MWLLEFMIRKWAVRTEFQMYNIVNETIVNEVIIINQSFIDEDLLSLSQSNKNSVKDTKIINELPVN